MLPLILASFLLAQTDIMPALPGSAKPLPEPTHFVDAEGNPAKPAEKALPYEEWILANPPKSWCELRLRDIHKQWPGTTGPSDHVPADHRLRNLPTFSDRRWCNAPCYLPYFYRFTDEQVPLLSIEELCSEMEMAACWNDTHYLERLAADLPSRFLPLEDFADPQGPAAKGLAERRLAPRELMAIDKAAQGRLAVGMNRLTVMLTARVGAAIDGPLTEDPMGVHRSSRYVAPVVRKGAPVKDARPPWGEEATAVTLLSGFTVTTTDIATLRYLQAPDEVWPRVTWFEITNGGFEARRAGMGAWREAILSEAPGIFTPEPPPAPAPDPSATLPGDFSKPLPTPPATPPADPNKPAPSLPPTPQPPPDR